MFRIFKDERSSAGWIIFTIATVRGEGKRRLKYQLASRSNFSYFLVQLPRPFFPWREARRSYYEKKCPGRERIRPSITMFLLHFLPSLCPLSFVDGRKARKAWIERLSSRAEELRGNKRLSINFLTNPF